MPRSGLQMAKLDAQSQKPDAQSQKLVVRSQKPEAPKSKSNRTPRQQATSCHLSNKNVSLKKMSTPKECLWVPKTISEGSFKRLSKKVSRRMSRTPEVARRSPKQEARDGELRGKELRGEEVRGHKLRGEDPRDEEPKDSEVLQHKLELRGEESRSEDRRDEDSKVPRQRERHFATEAPT